MIDLSKKHCTSLQVKAQVHLGQEMWAELMESCWDEEEEEAGRVTFVSSYSRMHVPHLAFGVVRRIGSNDGYEVSLRVVQVERVERPPKGIPSPVEMLTCLSKLEESVEFDCDVRFSYPANNFRTLMGLPIEYSEPVLLPFTLIRGYHVEKLENDQVVYEAIVDHGRDKEIWLYLDFSYESSFTKDLLKTILDESAHLASLFVIQVKETEA